MTTAAPAPAPASAAPLPYVAGPDCADRPYRAAPGPCSSGTNAHSHWRLHDCVEDEPYHGGYVHRTCGQCHDQAVNQPYLQRVHRALYDPAFPGNDPFTPPAPGAHNGWPWSPNTIGKWKGFLTRLCRSCEQIEQAKLHERITNPRGTFVIRDEIQPTPEMANWPRNTCTCKHFLGRSGPPPGIGGLADDRWCNRHRRLKLMRLVRARNRNDRWLRTLARDALGGACLANKQRLRTRSSAKLKAFRACRCGADPDTSVHPAAPGVAQGGAEVWMCMACTGLIHLVDPATPWSRYQ